jgi:tungstate transport system substrate-binding protein
MFNPYGIIAVNPAKHPGINYTDATKLIEWITSAAGQQAIAEFKVNGEQVFFPDYGKAVASGH